MRFTIRLQLLLPLVILILGVVGISAWTAWSSAERARAQIENQLDAITSTARAAPFPRDLNVLRLMKKLFGVDLLLHDEEGRTLTTFGHEPSDLPAPDATGSGLGAPVTVDGETFFCRAATRETSGQVMYVFYPEAAYRDAVWQAVRPSLILGIVGGLVSVALTVAATQRLTRRIQQLERRTRLIAAGDFSPMPLPRRDDELRDLGQSVNDMAQQLTRYQETMRTTERLRLLGQVSGGLAHQLRNGVTGARLAVQLHVREHPSDEEPLQVALRQLDLVEMQLKRFLDLGRAGELRRQACNLAAIATEAMALVAPQCRHAQIELRWGHNPPLAPSAGNAPSGTPKDVWNIEADAEQLTHVLVNILTNAAEAAGQGGKIEMRLTATPANVIALEVADSGPGPSAQVADRLFDPFVTGKPEGVGLGLAVARQVVQAHGGTITWRRDNDTTVFRIEVPRRG